MGKTKPPTLGGGFPVARSVGSACDVSKSGGGGAGAGVQPDATLCNPMQPGATDIGEREKRTHRGHFRNRVSGGVGVSGEGERDVSVAGCRLLSGQRFDGKFPAAGRGDDEVLLAIHLVDGGRGEAAEGQLA